MNPIIKRFFLVMVVAFAALTALGLLAPNIAVVLLGSLVIGLAMVVALAFFVLPMDAEPEHQDARREHF